MTEGLKMFGAIVLGIVCFVVFMFVIVLVLNGTNWVSERLIPWFSKASVFALIVLVLVLLPLSAFRPTRAFSAAAIMCVSYLFGATVWMEGFVLTMTIWGGTAVFIGLALGGIGVVPVALLATLIHRFWPPLFELLFLLILTFCSRGFALWIGKKIDDVRRMDFADADNGYKVGRNRH